MGALVILLAVLALTLVGCGGNDIVTATTSVGPAAAAFTGTTMDGDQVSLASFAGKPLVLAFWASW